jgi:Peptidase family M48
VALGGAGLGLTMASVITTLASFHHAAAGSGQVVLARVQLTYPTVNGPGAVLLVLGLLGAGVIAVAIRGVWRQLRAYRRLRAVLQTAETLARDPGVHVIRDARPQAFCAGYLRPAVYVSRRTIELLADAELDAVLAHERHHRRVRDPLRIACGRVLSEALFFLPVLRPLCDRYADVAELNADRAAVHASAGREAPLASALLVFDENALPGVTGISPERVDSLLGRPPSWRVPAWLFAASVGALSALGLVVWRSSETAAAHATFNLPILSSRPCVLVMSILAFAGCVRLLGGVPAGRRERSRR